MGIMQAETDTYDKVQHCHKDLHVDERSSLLTDGARIHGKNCTIPVPLPENDQPGSIAVVFYMHVFAYVIIHGIGGGVMTQFIYVWVSQNVEYHPRNKTDRIISRPCGLNSSAEENFYQKTSSEWSMYFTLVEKTISLPVLIIVGILSDRIGRKKLIVIAVFGQFLKYGIKAYLTYYGFSLHFYLIAYAVSGSFGSGYTFFLCSMATVADLTSNVKHRSMGYTIMEGATGFAASIYVFIDGYLIAYAGFKYTFIGVSGLLILLVLSIAFFGTETLQSVPINKSSNFVCDSLKQLVTLYTNKSVRKNQPLKRLVTILTAYLLLYFRSADRSTLEELYVLGSPFCWKSKHIGYYKASKELVHYAVAIIVLRLLKACVKDELTAILGNISIMASDALIFFAYTDLYIYLSASAGAIGVLPFPVIRGIMSKSVIANKQGMWPKQGISTQEGEVETFLKYICH